MAPRDAPDPPGKARLPVHGGDRSFWDASRPAAVSIETVFAAKNVSSALKLSHARGVLLAAAARSAVPVFEYEPRLVKKALVGYGQAEKEQVRAMVLSLLARQRSRVPLDAADALALAICHIHAAPGRARDRRPLRGRVRCVRGANSLPTGGREEVRAAGAGAQRGEPGAAVEPRIRGEPRAGAPAGRRLSAQAKATWLGASI